MRHHQLFRRVAPSPDAVPERASAQPSLGRPYGRTLTRVLLLGGLGHFACTLPVGVGLWLAGATLALAGLDATWGGPRRLAALLDGAVVAALLSLHAPPLAVGVALVLTAMVAPLAVALSLLDGRQGPQTSRSPAKALSDHSQALVRAISDDAAHELDTGHMLHEIRSSMNSLRLNLSFLREEARLGGDLAAALDDALSAQEQVEMVIGDAMDCLLRRRTDDQRTASVPRALRRALDNAPAGLHTEVRLPRLPGSVVGDEERLVSVIHNLLRNAAQAGARNTSIGVHLDPATEEVVIDVDDDGPGISKEAFGRLFLPQRGSTKADGMGVGLYLCRRSVESMGGEIGARNRDEGGARFTLRMPLVPGGFQPTQRPPKDSESALPVLQEHGH